MKIINTSVPVCRPFDREHFVDMELLRLIKDLEIDNFPFNYNAPLEQKENVLRFFDQIATDKQRGETGTEMATAYEHEPCQLNDFKSFALLPAELRIKIWEMAEENALHPRIHCIEERNSRFISNQPLSPLLHACHESRTCFLNSTETTFAFGSYVNFSRDIIYIYDANKPEGFLQRFLPSSHARQIEKLALTNDDFVDLPLAGFPVTFSQKLREWLPNWREWIIVFEEYRTPLDFWRETELAFKVLSAKQQRKRAERSFARGIVAKMYEGEWEEPLEFRYVVFDEMIHRTSRLRYG
jgi:hypothetical protein